MLENFQTAILNSLPVFTVILLTLYLRKRKVLNVEAKKSLGPIIFKIMIPFLIFRVFYGVKVTSEDLKLALIIVICSVLMAGAFGIYCYIKKWRLDVAGALNITVMCFAVGTFAFPFVQLNFDNNVFSKVVLLDIVLFVTIIVLGPIIANIYDSGENKLDFRKILKNLITDPILLTVIFTVALTILNVQVSQYFINVADFISKGFSFFVLVYSTLSLTYPDKERISQVLQTFIFRNVLLILIVAILFSAVLEDPNTKKALLLTVFTPFSAYGMIYTDKYRIDADSIAQISMFSQIVGLIIYPIVVTVALGI